MLPVPFIPGLPLVSASSLVDSASLCLFLWRSREHFFKGVIVIIVGNNFKHSSISFNIFSSNYKNLQ